MVKKRKALSLILALTMVFTGLTMPTQTIAKENTKAEQEKSGLSKKKVIAMAEEVIEKDDYVEGELLVVLKSKSSSMQDRFKATDFPEIKVTKIENLTYCDNPDSELISEDFKTVLSVTLKRKTDEELLKAIDSLMDREDVESVSLNEETPVEATQTVPTSDSQFVNQWALNKIDAIGAWSKTTGSSTVKVGIIDTGIDYTHEELAANMWTNPGETSDDGKDNDNNGYIDDVFGWNFHDNNNNVMDTHYHGTFCAGIVAADLNHKDVAGIAPNVKLVALKVGDDGFYSNAAVKAITYAANMGIDVVNYSSSFSSKNTAFEAALNNYLGIFVTSAGNNGRDNDVTGNYPKTSEHNNVIKVANTTSGDSLSGSSNYGVVDVTLAAPGSSVLSTKLNNTYGTGSGTSFSSPYVAGVAALIISAYPTLERASIINSIKEGVDKITSLSGKVETGGRLNANKAMEAARIVNDGSAARYRKDVYTYADFKEAMENDYYATVNILRDVELQGEIRLTRSKTFYGGAKLKGNGKRHFIIDTTNSVTLDLGGVIYENGGIENRSSDFQLEGSGAVIRNSSWTYGGAIYNLGSMLIDGVRIENCTATYGGGISNSGTMTVSGTTIFNNTASQGGAIYTTGPLTIWGGIFKSNTAQSGGAIYGDTDSQVSVISSPQITYNTAVNLGGGIYTKGILKTVIPDGLSVNFNNAKFGAGIYGATGSYIYLEGKSPGGPSISIANNQASSDGGGVYLDTEASLYLHNTFVAVNKAEGTGGAMLIKGTYRPGSFVIITSNTPDNIVYQ
ncbi:MAG: S8 family serine peptidase [Eubacterium sp.]